MTMDYRVCLRHETKAAHDRLDVLLSGLDIARRDDLAVFMQIHLKCFCVMQDWSHRGTASDVALAGMISRIRADLAALDASPALLVGRLRSSVHPLAMEYVIAGSRLGTKVLAGRWAQSTDPKVRAAHHYFGADITSDGWKAVCAKLTQIAPDSRTASEITRDALRLFNLFLAVSREMGVAADRKELLIQ